MSKILIAEDDSICRRLLYKTLERKGHEVIEAADGALAWELLQQHPDTALVITDMMMPHFDGRQFIEAMRASPTFQRLPVIIVSAYVGVNQISDILSRGASRFLPKPISIQILEEYVARCLGQSSAQEALG